MFSKTCEYAIRAMLFVAQRSNSGVKVGIKEISKNIDAPEHFIAKILQDLSRRGMVQSSKGPNGGFFFEKASEDYTLADIVRAIDGDKIFFGCALGLTECDEIHPCPLHFEMKGIRDMIKSKLEAVKLGVFNKDLEQKLIFLR
ncbi:MAG: Rrf2 family transcriptional regulator [Chitinophagaceae bacterium]